MEEISEGSICLLWLKKEISEGRNFSNLSKDHSCDNSAKIVAAFCTGPKNLPVAKLKSIGEMTFGEEISGQPSINFVLWLQ